MADPADIQRLIGDLVREGTVMSVDLSAGTARVKIAGDLVSGDLDWLVARAGNTRVWSPPSVGEQVVVLSPEADLARGIIIGSLTSDAHPHPAREDKSLVDFADGALLGYDPAAHALTAYLPAGATVTLVADGGLHFTGDMTVDGSIRSTGRITADDDVLAAGKSLKSHLHTGVQAGGALTGKPQ